MEHAEAFVKTIETYILRKEEEKRRQKRKVEYTKKYGCKKNRRSKLWLYFFIYP